MQQWRKCIYGICLSQCWNIIIELHGDKHVFLFSFNCLVQDCCVLAMELRQSCTKPLIWLLSVMRITSKAELFDFKSTFSIHINPVDTEISHLIIKRFDITWKAYHRNHIKFRNLGIWLNSYFVSGVRTSDENSYLHCHTWFWVNVFRSMPVFPVLGTLPIGSVSTMPHKPPRQIYLTKYGSLILSAEL